jgi:hypothetical protein
MQKNTVHRRGRRDIAGEAPREISASQDPKPQVRRKGRTLGRACGQPIEGGKHVILFLAANPRGSNLLKLSEECAEIERELRMSRHRDDFQLESRWAVSIDDLMRHLTELDPTVIHFSGHGSGESGLMLQDEHGEPQPVSGRALAMMIEAAARNLRVVVLNACYSSMQAEALSDKVDCIVGMEGRIGDEAARAFATRFYGALGNHRSIGNAVAHGIATLAAKQLPDEVLPRCLTRDGVDADDVILACHRDGGAT